MLCALIIGIFLLVKQVSTLSVNTVASLSVPLLAKINVHTNAQQVGEVAGKFAERISDTNIGTGISSSRSGNNTAAQSQTTVAKFAILADIHEDYDNMEVALGKAKALKVDRVLVLGDLTNFGDVPTLEKAKAHLDSSHLSYLVIPGDHDIAQSLDTSNFDKVFGTANYLVVINGVTILMLNNSANYTPIANSDMTWFNEHLQNADFVFLAQPLYTDGLLPPFNKMFMGSTRDAPDSPELSIKQQAVLKQGQSLLASIRQSNVKAIFAGDHHSSSILTDPVRKSLSHYVVGAITNTTEGYPQSIIETPRFSVLTVYNNGKYTVEDILLD
jgi:predicted phosphodiesterase